ncbi:hypothetical protein AB0M02_30315 [Actinoplanes sp. NPDC051861]|uniref:hypothetical protein n=1 Tax=Actinoplanes sp. NPDC051861 TaxID=3155170 RepID=UPI00341949D8
MIVRRLLVLLLFVLAPIPVAATPAWACSCKAGAGVAEAEVAFVGVVTSIDEAAGSSRVAFTVESVVKGDPPADVTLTTSDNEASCGYRFDQGGRYRVYAIAGQTSLCSGNEMITATPTYTARVERVSSDRIHIFWFGLGIVVVVVAAALTALLRQPREH